MSTHQDQQVIAVCSFCSKPNTEVGTLVAGPGVFICDGCVALCDQVIAGKAPDLPQLAPWEGDMGVDDALANLAPVARAAGQVERNLGSWVRKVRSLGGTWTRIGQALGMSRQAAWERFAGES